MTEAEKIAMVKTMSEETDEAVVSAYLKKAESAILNRLYSAWSAWPEEAAVPDRYSMTQCDLTVRYLTRRGGDGEVSHGENGIQRTWASPDDEDILRTITPIVEVPQ